jgi:hypothetical protein
MAVAVERALRVEDKVLGLPLIRNRSFSFFLNFPFGFFFSDFCRVRDFESLNSVLTKNLEINSSFFRIFYFKFFNFLKKSNLTSRFIENR